MTEPGGGAPTKVGAGVAASAPRTGAEPAATVASGSSPPGPRRRLLRGRFGVVGVVGAVGMAIAMGMATGFWWWEQSASALGTDPTGDAYFNLTMVLLGAAFVPVAFTGGDILLDARAAGLIGRRWGMLATVGLFTICLALALVGIYRIDEGPQASTIHNVAGFSVPLIVMAMMLTIRWNAGALSPRYVRSTYLWLVAIVAMFIVSVLELMSYALMEMVSFVICWWWLYGLLRALDDRLGPVAAPGPAG